MPTPSRSTLLKQVSSPTWPLSSRSWNIHYSGIHCNCMAFAFGLPIDTPNEFDFDEPGCISGQYQHDSIVLAVIDICTTLGLQYRRIDKPEYAYCDEYVIGAWGFYPFNILGFTHYDHHFIRRDLDGQWYHKPGWHEPPQKITSWEDDLAEYLIEGEPCFFAIKKETP